MFLSYRNQSVDLQSKSTDWFLYYGNIGRKKVKSKLKQISNKNWKIQNWQIEKNWK